MRKRSPFSCLYVITLSILLHSSCCCSRVVKSTHRLAGGQNVGNDDQQAVHQQLTHSLAEQKTLHSVQRRQLNNKQIQHGAYLAPIRRKREFEESASGRYRNPSVKQGLPSDELRSKKSDGSQVDQTDDDSVSSSANFHPLNMGGKLNGVKDLTSSSRDAGTEEVKVDQDGNSEKLSADGLRAVNLYGVHPNELLDPQPGSNDQLRSVNSEANPQTSLLKVKGEVQRDKREDSKVGRDKGRLAGLKAASGQSEAIEESSDALESKKRKITAEGENDEAAIAKRINGGESAEYENEAEDESFGSEREPVYKRSNAGHPSILGEDSDKISALESKGVVKRDIEMEEEYDDEDQGSFGEEANFVDTANGAMANDGDELEDARVKRDDGDRNAIAKETEREERSGDSKSEVNPNNLAKGENSESIEDERNEGKVAVGEQTAKEEVDDNSQQAKSANANEMANQRQEANMNGRDDESDSDYEQRVEQEIQRRIDSIKEEIKRDVERKQKIQEIEENNAKYDELQSKEDEDEDGQSLDLPSGHKGVSKRAVQQNPQKRVRRGKRRVLKRVKRSTNVRQLNEIEGVEKLDSDVYDKARLRHESIRKRSAPVYGETDKETDDPTELLLKKRSAPLVNNAPKRKAKKRRTKSAIIIPEQAHAKIQDELPSDLAVDRNLLLAGSSNDNEHRVKRRTERYTRRRRGNAVVPEGKVAFLGYRAQDDDENDEGNEFDDDGFEDRTSNLRGKTYADPYSGQAQYLDIDRKGNEPSNFLFASRNQNGYSVRRKRDEPSCEDDEQPASFKGGGSKQRRRAHVKAKRTKTARVRSPNNDRDRHKRFLGLAEDTKSGSVASLVSSSQDLSPQLASDYREAFGGLQNDPGGSFARFKRVKRDPCVS